MLCVCKFNSGRAIPVSQRYLGESDETSFSFLNIEEEYLIYSLLVQNDRIDFLVCPSGGDPFWVPSCLFKIVDSRIPPGWVFGFTRDHPDFSWLLNDYGVTCIIGYPLIVNDAKHYSDIQDGDYDELVKFFIEKERIKSWWAGVENEGA